jgi:hypothetical protein
MTQGAFQGLEQVAGSSVDQLAQDLIGKGVPAADAQRQALQLCAPQLAQLAQLSQQYGIKLDANTQSLIDQAAAAGIAFPTDPLMQVISLLQQIADKLGAIPRDTQANVNIHTNYTRSGTPPPGGGEGGGEENGTLSTGEGKGAGWEGAPRAASGLVVEPRLGGTGVVVGEAGSRELIGPVDALARSIGAGLAAPLAVAPERGALEAVALKARVEHRRGEERQDRLQPRGREGRPPSPPASLHHGRRPGRGGRDGHDGGRRWRDVDVLLRREHLHRGRQPPHSCCSSAPGTNLATSAAKGARLRGVRHGAARRARLPATCRITRASGSNIDLGTSQQIRRRGDRVPQPERLWRGDPDPVGGAARGAGRRGRTCAWCSRARRGRASATSRRPRTDTRASSSTTSRTPPATSRSGIAFVGGYWQPGRSIAQGYTEAPADYSEIAPERLRRAIPQRARPCGAFHVRPEARLPSRPGRAQGHDGGASVSAGACSWRSTPSTRPTATPTRSMAGSPRSRSGRRTSATARPRIASRCATASKRPDRDSGRGTGNSAPVLASAR